MRAKSNRNGNEKHMAKMGTTCPLKYLCSLLSQDMLPRAGEAVPHGDLRGPCLLPWLAGKRAVTERRDFPHQPSAPLWEKAGCGSISQILKQFTVRPDLGLGCFPLVTWHGGDWGRAHVRKRSELHVCHGAWRLRRGCFDRHHHSCFELLWEFYASDSVTFQGKVQIFGTGFFFFFKKDTCWSNGTTGKLLPPLSQTLPSAVAVRGFLRECMLLGEWF